MLPLSQRIAEREREHKEGPNKVVITVEPNKPGSFNGDDPNEDERNEAHFDRWPGQSKLKDKPAYTVEGDDTVGHSQETQAARDATEAADRQRAQELTSGAGGNGSGAGSPFPAGGTKP